ncbi:MAG TPA: FAD-dependent oxidoreductase [Ramlibacter sp.]|uniref:FAD-dependent oxidoreductase n=1 Tax=Ramlibacter sp. TaxID=1917967 RepID=UPI002ED642F4
MITRRALLAGAAALAGCESRPEVEGAFAGAAVERGHLLRTRRDWPAPHATHRTQVVIAGAGIAGLAAARALRQRRIEDFVLLDLEDAPGGNSRAGQVGGIACPLGAHYLPVPGDDAPEVQDLLEELGLRRRVAGRWEIDERHLCHAPQERLYFQGEWQEGLLPLNGVGATTRAQYVRFAREVAAARRGGAFRIPLRDRRPLRALDTQTFAQWLAARELNDPQLRWYLDYCCRDDYGAGIATVSAWAGLHYFAARHGFHPPDADEGGERDALLTWPEGNGFLARALAAPLQERFRGGRLVLRIAQQRHGVEVDTWDVRTQRVERWQAQQCIVALPAFVAARVIENPPAAVTALARMTRHAPWVVANLHLREPLWKTPGAAPAWDNVVYGSETSLGYVDATHQDLNPAPGPTVLTWYCAPGEPARGDVLQKPWTDWRDRVVKELSVPHRDLERHLTRVEVTRYGHAMPVPVPGALSKMPSPPPSGRLRFAHSDWAGYSIFEEAFTLGDKAGRAS